MAFTVLMISKRYSLFHKKQNKKEKKIVEEKRYSIMCVVVRAAHPQRPGELACDEYMESVIKLI